MSLKVIFVLFIGLRWSLGQTNICAFFLFNFFENRCNKIMFNSKLNTAAFKNVLGLVFDRWSQALQQVCGDLIVGVCVCMLVTIVLCRYHTLLAHTASIPPTWIMLSD